MEIKLKVQASEPLTGEDADRFVAYIDDPKMPVGHNEFLNESDRVYGELQQRSDTSS